MDSFTEGRKIDLGQRSEEITCSSDHSFEKLQRRTRRAEWLVRVKRYVAAFAVAASFLWLWFLMKRDGCGVRSGYSSPGRDGRAASHVKQTVNGFEDANCGG
jgi:hypothetical protein